jgi:uncharacterized protein (DUF488 family)
MKHRQRILLAFIQKADGSISRTKLVKLAFLLGQEGSLDSRRPFYDFLPYKYGPYSFTLDRELSELGRLGYMDVEELSISPAYQDRVEQEFQAIDTATKSAIYQVQEKYGTLSLDALIKRVYEDYPWYARNSELVDASEKHHRERAPKCVCTAGYEGESIDYFINKLLAAGITLVIDVRYNPISRKYGFSKKTLSTLCGKLEIDYTHVPELGIPSRLRNDLKTSEDYQALMEEYSSTILPKADKHIDIVSAMMQEQPSLLLCFEADVNMCHRGRLAKAIALKTGMEIVHV